MGLVAALQRAKEQRQDLVHLDTTGMENSPDDAQRRIRRKMRIHPRITGSIPGSTFSGTSHGRRDMAEAAPRFPLRVVERGD